MFLIIILEIIPQIHMYTGQSFLIVNFIHLSVEMLSMEALHVLETHFATELYTAIAHFQKAQPNRESLQGNVMILFCIMKSIVSSTCFSRIGNNSDKDIVVIAHNNISQC